MLVAIFAVSVAMQCQLPTCADQLGLIPHGNITKFMPGGRRDGCFISCNQDVNLSQSSITNCTSAEAPTYGEKFIHLLLYQVISTFN